MPLSAGSRLGFYEVLAPLGAGGMGEVYRAKDTRLGRDVALKVLPTEAAGDAGRRSRFEQEARAASALAHPNIVAIYDVGESDGSVWIAMELIEGRTVRDLLASGPLPIRRALEIGTQIAEGLAAAHAAGIVHRDLKPENLIRRPVTGIFRKSSTYTPPPTESPMSIPIAVSSTSSMSSPARDNGHHSALR